MNGADLSHLQHEALLGIAAEQEHGWPSATATNFNTNTIKALKARSLVEVFEGSGVRLTDAGWRCLGRVHPDPRPAQATPERSEKGER